MKELNKITLAYLYEINRMQIELESESSKLIESQKQYLINPDAMPDYDFKEVSNKIDTNIAKRQGMADVWSMMYKFIEKSDHESIDDIIEELTNHGVV